MFYCAVDTNIFLHYRLFDQIDWTTICNTNEVCLFVPAKVIHELDECKYDSREHIRKRAIRVLKQIENRAVKQGTERQFIKRNTAIQIEVNGPNVNWLQSHGYDASNGDDCILGAIEYFTLHNPGVELALFSGDTGIRLKAMAHSIRVITPPDELRDDSQVDPLRQENQRLERELQQYRTAQPEFVLGFLDEGDEPSNLVNFTIDFSDVGSLESDLDQRLASKYEELKYRGRIEGELSEDSRYSAFTAMASLMSLTYATLPSRKDVDTYHEELRGFLATTYRNYLMESHAFKKATRTVRSLGLVLKNDGKKPGTNIDVLLHFPDGIHVFERLSSPPDEPEPPKQPRVRSIYSDMILWGGRRDLVDSLRYTPKISYAHTPGPSLSIRRTNSYEVTWGPIDLKHSHTYELPELYLSFEAFEGRSTSFEIDYRITANELLDVAEGKLSIVVHRSHAG